MPEIVCLCETKNVLGEGPIWNDEDRSLYWCDNIAGRIHRYTPGTAELRTWETPEEIGSLVFRRNGGIVAGMKSGYSYVDLASGRFEHIVAAEPETDNCLNDGKCDRRGRYWCGTINRDPKGAANGGLYRLDSDLSVHKMESGISASNGIAFSPDDKTLYFADSRQDTVWAYDLDIDSGNISNRRVFISTKDMPARVDGATVDTQGNYWCALIFDWDIACFDPKGRLLRRIRMPVRHPTMCTFGGDDHDVLFVTSATRMLEPQDSENQPQAGALFAIYDVGAKGFPEPRFAG